MPCRARELAAHRSLPGRVARRSKSLVVPWLAFPVSSSCRGLVLRAAVPASSSCRGLAPFEWSSRQAPLAGASCLGLNTLFLDGPKGTMEGFGDHLASLATGRYDCPCTSSGY